MLIHAFLLSLVFTVTYGVPSRIDRPCKLSHYGCIGDNLAVNSRCNRDVSGRLPTSYHIPRFIFHTPSVNASYIDQDLIIRNHDKCYVSEFFFNKDTKTALIGINCPNLEFQSTRQLIQHIPLSEDVVLSYNYKGLYPLIRLTVTLQLSNALDMCRTRAYADVTGLPSYEINPNDKRTADSLSRDLSLLNVFERETMWWRANSLTRFFVNSMLCDFGCDL